MKPNRQLPFAVRLGFIILEAIAVGLSVIFFFAGSPRVSAIYGDTFVFVEVTLLAVLLLSSIALLFFDRHLALSGFIAFVLGALAGIEPQYYSTLTHRSDATNVP